MAAANPLYAAPRSMHGPVLLDGLNKVRAACGMKPAALADERAQRPLVYPRRGNQQPGRQVPQKSRQPCHDPRCSVPRLVDRARRSSRPADSENLAINWAKCGGSGARTTHTKSRQGNSCCDNRNASRNNRFQRFRATAFPTRREIVMPSRAQPASFAAPYKTKCAFPSEFRAANTRSNSPARNNRNRFENLWSRIKSSTNR